LEVVDERTAVTLAFFFSAIAISLY